MRKESFSETQRKFNLLVKQIPTKDLRAVTNEELRIKNQVIKQAEMNQAIEVFRSNLPTKSHKSNLRLAGRDLAIKTGVGAVIITGMDVMYSKIGINNAWEQIGINIPILIPAIVALDSKLRRRR